MTTTATSYDIAGSGDMAEGGHPAAEVAR